MTGGELIVLALMALGVAASVWRINRTHPPHRRPEGGSAWREHGRWQHQMDSDPARLERVDRGGTR